MHSTVTMIQQQIYEDEMRHGFESQTNTEKSESEKTIDGDGLSSPMTVGRCSMAMGISRGLSLVEMIVRILFTCARFENPIRCVHE